MQIKDYFPDLDMTQFWDDDELALEEYVDETPSDTLIASVETEPGLQAARFLHRADETAQWRDSLRHLFSHSGRRRRRRNLRGNYRFSQYRPQKNELAVRHCWATSCLKKAGTIPTTVYISAIALPPVLTWYFWIIASAVLTESHRWLISI